MSDAQCVAIIAALYQHAADVTPETRGTVSHIQALSMAGILLDAAKRAWPNV